ncbi:hypothetical protein HYW82_04125 [Candidatus Peregrinibacteria bacterium]|nr:hypothetical protein [Candidatus Peregrinibacteria bacterium]
MTNRDKYFKGQQDKEEFVCFMRQHWIVLVKEFIYLIVFLLVCYFTLANIDSIQEVLRGNREMKLLFATAFFIGTLYIHRFFIKIFNYFLQVGIITDTRIVEHQKTLFMKDSMDSIDMAQIQNIERVGDGILPNLLGYGHIKIFLSASSAVKTFQYVPNAKFHFRLISRQKEIRQNQLAREHRQVASEAVANEVSNLSPSGKSNETPSQ